jgi:opacity protein-like surface antigen
MKKELLAATALTASAVSLGPGVAWAQAMPFDWTGTYLGIGAGLAETSDRVGTSSHGGVAFSGHWPVGSVAAGINRDVGNAVYGLEVDFNFLGARNSGETSDSDSAEVQTSLDHLLTLRGRLGMKADRTIYFATGGLAAGNASLSTSFGDPVKGSGSRSSILLGWSGGVGAEFAATETMTVSVMALYYALSPLTVSATGSQPYTATYTPDGWILRAGVNFRR